MFGLINAGHSSKLIALAYAPWVFLTADYCLRKKTWRGVLLLAIAASLQLWANHPQVVYYTWMVVVFWWLWLQTTNLIDRKWAIKSEGKATLLILSGLLIALLIVSTPYVFIYEFQGHSNRGAPSVLDQTGETESGVKWDYATQWSFEPYELISFIYPYYYGLQNFPTRDVKSAAYWGGMPFTQSTHYFGLLVILIAILGAVLKKPDRFQTFLWVTSVLILLVGFGRHLPILFSPLFHLAPFFSKFRVPSMIYALLPLNFSLLAAFGLDALINRLRTVNPENIKRLQKPVLIVFGSVIVLSLIYLLFGSSTLSFFKTGEANKYDPQIISQIKNVRADLFQKGLILALVLSGGGLAVIWLGLKGSIKAKYVGLTLVGLTIIDLWVVNNEFLFLHKTRKMEQQFQANAITDFLTADKDLFRIFPVDDLNTNWYGYFGLASIGGYRPVKLRTYQDLMDAGGLNNVSILNMLNVKYLITSKNIPHPSMKLVLPGARKVYENTSVLPKAWMVNRIINADSQKESLEKVFSKDFAPDTEAIVNNYDAEEISSTGGGDVIIEAYTENEIVLSVDANASGLLVLSENYYAPGWRASVDGQATKLYQTNHVLRSVVVPAGKHAVKFWYDNYKWQLVRIISRLSLLMTLIMLGWIYRSRLIVLIRRQK
ncbi:MAG: YfhO family protein [Candidatus Marinimicrobia bacterium]|nr:YfhO family protein [Candidatus Neomarinimicrobiota bacterium]